MQTTSSNPTAGRDGPVDGLALWAAESPSGPVAGPLSAVRLSESETMIVPFTTVMMRQALHYVDSPHLRGYVRCVGQGCLLCRVGNRVDTRDLLPVYDPIMRVVSVLPISPTLRPSALRPQIHPLLLRINSGERLLVTIRKLDQARFGVNACQLPEDADHGTEQIALFTELMEAGAIDLSSAYPRIDATELAAIPEIANRMAIKGIKVS